MPGGDRQAFKGVVRAAHQCHAAPPGPPFIWVEFAAGAELPHQMVPRGIIPSTAAPEEGEEPKFSATADVHLSHLLPPRRWLRFARRAGADPALAPIKRQLRRRDAAP